MYLRVGLEGIAQRLEKKISKKARRDGNTVFVESFGRLSIKHQRLIIAMVDDVVPMMKETHSAALRKEKRHGKR